MIRYIHRYRENRDIFVGHYNTPLTTDPGSNMGRCYESGSLFSMKLIKVVASLLREVVTLYGAKIHTGEKNTNQNVSYTQPIS